MKSKRATGLKRRKGGERRGERERGKEIGGSICWIRIGMATRKRRGGFKKRKNQIFDKQL